MKNIYKNLCFMFTLIIITNAVGQIELNTIEPEGALEITSTTTGLVPPRLVLSSTALQAPVTNPKLGITLVPNGTVVSKTNTINNVVLGLYYLELKNG
jgi:hypothetical protein